MESNQSGLQSPVYIRQCLIPLKVVVPYHILHEYSDNGKEVCMLFNCFFRHMEKFDEIHGTFSHLCSLVGRFSASKSPKKDMNPAVIACLPY